MKRKYCDISEVVCELSTLVYRHFGKGAMSWTGVDKLTEYAHNEYFVEHVLCMYRFLKERSFLFLSINPSQYYKLIYKFQLASKESSYSTDQICECYFFLANYAIRCYNKNFLDLKDYLQVINFSLIIDYSVSRRLCYLSALIRSYSEILYCDEHTIAGEIYSPIEYGEEVVIARKYRWLNPYELYTELYESPYSGINIYISYRNLPVSPKTDIVGNFIINENISKYMHSFYIEAEIADGERVTISSMQDIDSLIEYFEKLVVSLSKQYRDLSLERRLWNKVLCEYYSMKPYADEAGINWKPSFYNINLQDITSKGRPIVKSNQRVQESKSDCEIMKELKILNDPRIHWAII